MTHEEKLLALCANIRYLRRTHGLSKRKMAGILGVGVNTITALENDIVPRRLGSSALVRASQYFMLRTNELFSPMEK
ncbi:MAG: helix-turn-helix domain-containing protein [Oscillospiraceae bacterium]